MHCSILRQMVNRCRRPHWFYLRTKKMRLQTEAHQNWAKEDWKNLVWSHDFQFLLKHFNQNLK